MPYNNFLLVVALKPRMNTDIYIYIYIYMCVCILYAQSDCNAAKKNLPNQTS